MRRLLLFLLALAAIGTSSWFLLREDRIDRCLDDGGRWDYSSAACEGARG